jgi:mycofactocin glycosyltransferase
VRYVVDGSWRRFGQVVIAGSPLRLFKLTARGAGVAACLEAGTTVAPLRLVDRLLEGGAIHPSYDMEHLAAHHPSDVTIVTPQLGGDIVDRHLTDLGDDRRRIVVDDGSEPALVGAALRLAMNRGPGAARNAGRTLANTALIAFVDADVTLHRGWLDALLPHFDDPHVGLVAPRVTGERGSPLDLGKSPARIRAGTRVGYVPGAAIVMRVRAFDAVGGFDERMRVGEDVDLVWRLDEAGWRCRYEPACEVWHRTRATWRETLRQHATYGSSASPLSLRHPHSLAPFSSNGWTATAWALVVTGHPFGALGVALGSAALLRRTLTDVPSQVAFGLAMRGHIGAAQQLASSIRRVWWPLLVIGGAVGGGVLSRRLRWIGVAAALADVRSTPTDVAYGWGVWRSMLRYRTAAPIIPQFAPWPPKRRREPRR